MKEICEEFGLDSDQPEERVENALEPILSKKKVELENTISL